MTRALIDQASIDLAAARLRVQPAAVRAVIAVESNGSGFMDDGRPKILYEAHRFSALTAGQYDHSHPTLSSPHWNRALYTNNEYLRLYQAMQLNANAAIQACSWGLFQILGSNWQDCGEKSLMGFVLGMHHDERTHLMFFVELLLSWKLDGALRRGEFDVFAAKYNGPGYKANHYDTKLASAFAAHGGHIA
jgi:hypothetical protein